ncbi:hypothetical protein V7111_05560 [Neobacillus niacini]|uniref:hypothetical protein n=1 Tax=Neobacillus niacini TaxID=86668 RepID=UPI002FFFB897
MQKHVDISNLELEKLSNEFAMVRFGKVRMGNGERLLIQSSGGEQVLLDPTILDAIASLGHEELSRLLVAVTEL